MRHQSFTRVDNFTFYLQHLWFVLPVSLNRMHSPCLTFSGEIMFAFLASCWGVLTCTKALAYLWYIYFRPVGMRVTIGPQGPWVVVRGDFGWHYIKQGPVSLLVWHEKYPSLLKGHMRRTKAYIFPVWIKYCQTGQKSLFFEVPQTYCIWNV